ncbi:fructokinase/N-acetylglucosamine kinase [Poseidonocella pacifica]|uniref:Fructokinase/N-acetylglucosamine kinase n=1 Tax=Poseidonocella pacifica TaxID=871651 RepID=A0A1I0YMY2_9RHOB|nr:ROK family protein [Poseidonocella pacifica]SFB14765.1 fructokinase/N-acetylglucosamine kinase [Poseidonocella pacifica]
MSALHHIASGIDLGGTKIALRHFGRDLALVGGETIATPKDYRGLVDALAYLGSLAGDLPLGVSAAGQLHPATEVTLTANLCATGKPIKRDLTCALGRPVTWLNDAQAFALSEARCGAGRGATSITGLVIGTGLGAAHVVGGHPLARSTGLGGEVGHAALPADIVGKYGLPVLDCSCGRRGCIETYVSGAGLSRLDRAMTGGARAAEMISAERGPVWGVFCALLAEVLWSVQVSVDPEVFVIGGGVSRAPELLADVEKSRRSLPGFDLPLLRLAEGGAESGARGAALAALEADGA